jgi:hypothetical protein
MLGHYPWRKSPTAPDQGGPWAIRDRETGRGHRGRYISRRRSPYADQGRRSRRGLGGDSPMIVDSLASPAAASGTTGIGCSWVYVFFRKSAGDSAAYSTGFAQNGVELRERELPQLHPDLSPVQLRELHHRRVGVAGAARSESSPTAPAPAPRNGPYRMPPRTSPRRRSGDGARTAARTSTRRSTASQAATRAVLLNDRDFSRLGLRNRASTSSLSCAARRRCGDTCRKDLTLR